MPLYVTLQEYLNDPETRDMVDSADESYVVIKGNEVQFSGYFKEEDNKHWIHIDDNRGSWVSPFNLDDTIEVYT